jgi:hypothetical protein
MSYEGWKNYETWATNLWISNEEPTYRHVVALASARENDEPYDLSNEIKEFVSDEMMPDLGASLASDLLSAAVSEIDWIEIAEHWIADCPLPEDDDD